MLAERSLRTFTSLQPAAVHASVMAAARTLITAARPSAPSPCWAAVAAFPSSSPFVADPLAGLPTGGPRGLYATAQQCVSVWRLQ